MANLTYRLLLDFTYRSVIASPMAKTTELVKAEESPQTGHRPGRRPDEPRNFTVCFTATEREKSAVDALSMCINLRRSAILTEIVTRFMAAAENPPRGASKRTALMDFLEECQEQIEARRKLFDSLVKEK